MTTTDTYKTARITREDARYELDHAARNLRSERRRDDAYSAIARDAGGCDWQQRRADTVIGRIAEAERRYEEATEAYDRASVLAHVALTQDGYHDACVREGRLSASGGLYSELVPQASRARAEELGLDWDVLHAAWQAQAPERAAGADDRHQRRLALAGRLGRAAQMEAQRSDTSWAAAGHPRPVTE